MSNITTITNPLMQLIDYKGETYFSGQYFHQIYRGNSNTRGKYKRAGDFMRLIRSIEAYKQYVDDGDIVEIKSLGDIPETETPNLRLAFKANNYAGVMLINATAQVALTHHLDDEVSKKASVNINRDAANTQKPLTPLQQAKAAAAMLGAFVDAGKILGTEPAMAKAVGVNQVREKIGLDFSPLLGNNSVKEVPLNPTGLGEEVGLGARAMNKALLSAGLQKKVGDKWLPTEKAEGLFTMNPFQAKNSAHTGYELLWFKRVLDKLNLRAMA